MKAADKPATFELVGIKGHASDATIGRLQEIAERFIRRWESEFPASHLAIHYKAHETGPASRRTRFTVNGHLTTDGAALVATHDDWDAVPATEGALEELGRKVSHHKDARMADRRDRRTSPPRRSGA